MPAVDVLKSVSRGQCLRCNTDLETRQITCGRRMLAIYQDMAEMIRLGAYKKGTDPEVDLAINYYTKLEEFLNQKPNEASHMPASYKKLGEILGIKE